MGRHTRIAVDSVIVKDGKLFLVKRSIEPFTGKWVLPGGGVNYGETVEHATAREAKEETGLDVEAKKIFGIYSKPGRDPRTHVISIVFICELKGGNYLKATNETEDAGFFAFRETEKLKKGFDHEIIIRDLHNAGVF